MRRTTAAGRFRVRFVTVLTLLYLLFVLLVTLWPTTVDQGLDPYIDRLLQELHERGVPGFVDYGFVESLANVAFFVPVGFLGGLLFSRRWWWLAMPAAAALSGLIEAAQGAFLPGRVSSTADVIANTAGAVVGTVAAHAVRRLILHRDELVVRDVLDGRRASDAFLVEE